MDSSTDYLNLTHSRTRTTICQKVGIISEKKTMLEARATCEALNDTLWNGNWSAIAKYNGSLSRKTFWTNLVRINLTHFASNENEIHIPESRISKTYGPVSFYQRVVAKLIYDGTTFIPEGKTVSNLYPSLCYCWANGLFSDDMTQFTLEWGVVILIFIMTFLFGEIISFTNLNLKWQVQFG